MDVVVDTSVLLAIVTNEEDKPALIRATIGADLLAPASVTWEIGNALSAMLKRERITLDEGQRALAVCEAIPIRYVEVELDESLRIAAEHDIYAYDAYLLRCALKYRSPLLTLDRGLLHVAGQLSVRLLEVE